MRDPRHAGLSRQHQPRVRRLVLDGMARHAHAELRPGAPAPRHAQAHDTPPAAGRLAVPQHQYRWRGEVHRGWPHHRRAWRPRRQQPPDGDFNARAPRISLYRRHPEQPNRQAEARRRRPGLDRLALLLVGEMTLFSVLDYFRGRAVTIPPMDGPLRPNNDLEEADAFLAID